MCCGHSVAPAAGVREVTVGGSCPVEDSRRCEGPGVAVMTLPAVSLAPLTLAV